MSLPTGKKTGRSRSNLAYVRLLIAGDQPRVRQSLGALFTVRTWNTPSRTEICIEVVGEADDGRQAIAQMAALHPDVVLLDLPTQDPANQVSPTGLIPDGLAMIRLMKSRWPSVRIVVLTMYEAERSAVVLAGADVFLIKGCPTNELLNAVMTLTH